MLRLNDVESGYLSQSNTDIYQPLQLEVSASHLWVAPYNDYQQLLYDTITDCREEGWNYQQIADWLNEKGYSTLRGKKFRNNHTHSIIKKKRIRDEKINKTHTPILSNFSIKYIDKTLINRE